MVLGASDEYYDLNTLAGLLLTKARLKYAYSTLAGVAENLQVDYFFFFRCFCRSTQQDRQRSSHFIS